METGLIISDFIAQVVFPVLGGLLLVLVNILALFLKKKWGIEIDAQNKEKIRELALDAVSYAEEFGAKWAKEQGSKLDSDSKRTQAMMWMLLQAPELTEEEAEQYLMSALNFLELGASGKKNGLEDA